MDPRRKNSWDAFKPAGGRFEERPRPTNRSQIYSAICTLILGLLFGTAVGIILMLFIVGFSTSGLIAFFRFGRTPGWLYLGVFAFAVGWAVWNWYQGLREEAGTRERLEKKRGKSLIPWKARPPESDDEEGPESRN